MDRYKNSIKDDALNSAINSYKKTMKTKRKSSSIILVLMVLMCCYQSSWAGVVVKQGKTKNSTNVNPTTKHPKVVQKIKATTTTLKPEVETVKPSDMELDGRSAFINNHYVADEDPITDDTPPLYEMLQQQMETVLSNTGNNVQVYPNTPQMKEIINDDDGNNYNESDKQKPPGKPLFSYDMHQFDEYDEEDAGVEDTIDREEQPENCEDTEESLTDNDDSTNYAGVPPQTNTPNPDLLQNSYGQSPSAQNSQQNNPSNNPYDSSNYAPQTNSNQELSYGQTNKPIQAPQKHSSLNSHGQLKPSDYPQTIHKPPQNVFDQSKLKPSSGTNQQNNYGQSKPLEESQKSPQNNNGPAKHLEQHKPLNQKTSTYEKPKTQKSPKPHRHSSKSPQNSQKPNNTQLQNPAYTQNNQQQTKPNDSQKTMQTNNNIVNNGISVTPSSPNSSYSNSNPKVPLTPSSSYSNSDLAHSSHSNPSYDHLNPTSSLPSNPSFANTYPSSLPNSSYGSSYSSSLPPINSLFDNSSSSPFSTLSGTNKIPNNDRRRHLTFRTVSSSSQFVSTPLADLMFKFSISMAKPSNLGNDNVNQAQIYNKNDLEQS